MIKDRLFDVRIRARLISRGLITADDVAQHLEALTDVEDESTTLDIAQPAVCPKPVPPAAPEPPAIETFAPDTSPGTGLSPFGRSHQAVATPPAPVSSPFDSEPEPRPGYSPLEARPPISEPPRPAPRPYVPPAPAPSPFASPPRPEPAPSPFASPPRPEPVPALEPEPVPIFQPKPTPVFEPKPAPTPVFRPEPAAPSPFAAPPPAPEPEPEPAPVPLFRTVPDTDKPKDE